VSLSLVRSGGRGAFVNGHEGNHQLRRLAVARKAQFDAGNYTEKKALATEVVVFIRNLDPPGRFLKKLDAGKPIAKGVVVAVPPEGDEAGWEDLNEDKSIHKACQVMRDLDRLDRRERDQRRKLRKTLLMQGKGPSPDDDDKSALDTEVANSDVVDEAVAAAEEAMDEELQAANAEKDEEVPEGMDTFDV
jgi:hypothetical protein